MKEYGSARWCWLRSVILAASAQRSRLGNNFTLFLELNCYKVLIWIKPELYKSE